MIAVNLYPEQSRKVTVDHITNQLIIYKQYLDDTQFSHYKYMLNLFATLDELDVIAEKFDRAWPTDVTWDSI